MTELTTQMQESFNIARILRLGLGVGWRRAPMLLLLGLMAQVPGIVLASHDSVDLENPGALIRLVALALSSLMMAAVSCVAITDLKGRQPSFLKCTKVALIQMYPILGVGLLLGLFPMLISYEPRLLTALLLPWLVITTLLYAAIPAVVEEQAGFRYSLLRSAQLTRGRRWRILAILSVLGFAKIALTKLAENALPADQDTLLLCLYLGLDLVIEIFAGIVAGVSYLSLVRSFRPS